jgi:hypothetical protein
VSFVAARVAMHRSARSKCYNLSREGADPTSLVRGGVCADVLARCVLSGSIYALLFDRLLFFLSLFLDVAPASLFTAYKEMARVTFVVKR